MRIGPRVGSCGSAAYKREPVFATDIASDPHWADYVELAANFGLGSCCSTPVFSSDGILLGTVAMYYRRPHEPSAHDRELIRMATHLAGIVIERARAVEQLRVAKGRGGTTRAGDHNCIPHSAHDPGSAECGAGRRGGLCALSFAPPDYR